jgi:pyrroline-5-carboxylate reductase
MAEAIVKAVTASGMLRADQLVASDPSDVRRALFTGLGVTCVADNETVIRQSKQVLIAVKPQVMLQAAADLGRFGAIDQVIITIMAGVSSTKLAAAIAAGRGGAVADVRVIRVMPNTPLQVGFGMAGIALGNGAKPGDEALALKLFTAGGKAVVVPESAIDAITAVSGSGPAYVFYLAEAMEAAAVKLGLGEHARVLVAQTILGSAQLLAASTDTPAELRRKVTSPGGTTEAAIKHMDGNKTIDVVVNAIKAAEARSKELGA